MTSTNSVPIQGTSNLQAPYPMMGPLTTVIPIQVIPLHNGQLFFQQIPGFNSLGPFGFGMPGLYSAKPLDLSTNKMLMNQNSAQSSPQSLNHQSTTELKGSVEAKSASKMPNLVRILTSPAQTPSPAQPKVKPCLDGKRAMVNVNLASRSDRMFVRKCGSKMRRVLSETDEHIIVSNFPAYPPPGAWTPVVSPVESTPTDENNNDVVALPPDKPEAVPEPLDESGSEVVEDAADTEQDVDMEVDEVLSKPNGGNIHLFLAVLVHV